MPNPYLSEAELAKLRQEQIELIAAIGTTGNIYRVTYQSDGEGGSEQVLALQYENEPLRHWISSGPNGTSEEARFWGEQELNQTDAFVVLRWDIDLHHTDILVVGGRKWRVVGIQSPDAHYTATRARVEGLRGDV